MPESQTPSAWQARLQDRTVEILQDLVAIDSSVGSERAIIERIQDYLLGYGYAVEIIDDELPATHPQHPGTDDAPPGVWGIVAQHRTASDPPAYALFSHVDSEPAHSGWQQDPLVMVRDGDLLSGLGAADAKSGIAAILSSVEAIAELGGPNASFPDLIFGAAKHGGSRGMIQAISRMRQVRRVIYCHAAESGSGLAELKVASRGILSQRWRFTGDPAPQYEENTRISADPRQAVNPLVLAAEAVASLRTMDPENLIHNVSGLVALGPEYGIPPEAYVDVETWFTTGSVTQVDHEIVSKISAGIAPYGERAGFSSEITGLRANPANNNDDVCVAEVIAAIASITQTPVSPYSWHTSSDIRLPMLLHGIPTVGFGPLAGGFYGPGEWVSAKSLGQTAAVLVSLLTA